MALNSILKFFQPKDKIFFSLFEKAATEVNLMSVVLNQFILEPSFEQKGNLLESIIKKEQEVSDLTHKILWELGRNFITPIDREDIHALATSIDDCADLLRASAKKIFLYQVDSAQDAGMIHFGKLIVEGGEMVTKAVYELRNIRNLRVLATIIINISNLEKKADDIYDENIHHLFKHESDAKALIKKREIYQNLELVTDKYEELANVIESVMIKYA